MANPIRWGILGASRFAGEHTAPAIHLARGAQLAGLATSHPEKAMPFQGLAPDLRVFDSYQSLIDAPDIDAVYVPLPNHLHVEWSRACLAAGKPVLCEKPIALSAPEIDSLISARDQSGLLASEAYMIVHHPQWQRARDLVSEGAIGRVVHVTGAFSYNNPDKTNIRNRPETGGGSLPDIGVYTIGSTRFVLGLNDIEVQSADITWENGVEVAARVTARAGDVTIDWMTSMRAMPHQEVTFHGTHGLLRLTAPFNPKVFGEAQLELRLPQETRIERFVADNHYVNQFEAFGAAMSGEATWPWPLEQAQFTQKVIDDIYKMHPAP